MTVALLALAAVSAPQFSVLVFSKTAGFRHDSIPNGVEAIRKMGVERDFAVEHSEDAAVFTADNLAKHKVVVFLSTTGDILDADQQSAMEGFVQKGGGFVGIHAAADTEYDWPWFGKLVGAYFMSHPHIQDADIHVEDASHPSTRFLPKVWRRKDEWYDYKTNPRSQVKVLLTLDEKSYQGGKMGADHPIAWQHESLGGRAWYTAGGHTKESYTEPLFVRHVAEGILWAAGR